MTIKAVGYKTGLLSQKFIVNWALADLNIRGTFLEFKVLFHGDLSVLWGKEKSRQMKDIVI